MTVEKITLSHYVQDALHMKWIRFFGISPKKSPQPTETTIRRDNNEIHVTQKMTIDGKICELSARIKEHPQRKFPQSIEFTACSLPTQESLSFLD